MEKVQEGHIEQFKYPLWGHVAKYYGIEPIDRSNTKKAIKSLKKVEKEIIKNKSSFLIAPEGTRSKNGSLGEFKKGAFKLALDHKLPILPLVFLDCKRKFPWYTTHGYPGSLRVKELDVIQVKDMQYKSIESLQKKAYKLIRNSLEKDPKKRALEAIKIWENKTN